jgi:valyl-tRNA synthetase
MQYGTDAFRFTLTAFAAQGRDVKMSEKRVEGYRNFINKLWNAARFSLMHLTAPVDLPEIDAANRSLPDRWILSRLSGDREVRRPWTNTASTMPPAPSTSSCGTNSATGIWRPSNRPFTATRARPASRPRSGVLWRVLHDTLILLHPFVPFVTEEIWHQSARGPKAPSCRPPFRPMQRTAGDIEVDHPGRNRHGH